MSIENLYNSIFSLYSNDITGYDSIGGTIRSAVLLNSYPCYYTMLTGNKAVAFGKSNIVSTHRLFCSIIDISTTDLIYITNEGWFEVLYIDRCNNMSHHLEVYLYRADAPQILDDSSSSSSSSSYVENWSSSSSSSQSSSSSSSSSK